MELSPVITALVMTGRVGASIAAEIGTMRVSEQIDALETLSFDPVSFLIMPRVISGAIMFPVMVVIADFFGLLGGFFAATTSIGISSYDYVYGLRDWFVPWYAIFGVIKAFSFVDFESPINLAKQYEDAGAGEILINDVDNDGMMSGYNEDLFDEIRSQVSIPITFLGGAGSDEDFKKMVKRFGVLGLAAGSYFVFKGKLKAVLISYPDNDLKKQICNANYE